MSSLDTPSTGAAGRILIAEHEHAVRHLICLHLELEAFACEAVADAPAALRRLETGAFDLLVVDLTSPGLDAHRLFESVRDVRRRQYVPLFMLATDATRAAAVAGLENGADDYLIQPFGVREFVARVRALLRSKNARARQQSERGDASGVLAVDDLEIDAARRRVRSGGRAVRLTEQEFQLLYALAADAGRVFTRSALLARVWGRDRFVTVRSVDTLVRRVRRQLAAITVAPARIQTVRGVGYRFAARRSA